MKTNTWSLRSVAFATLLVCLVFAFAYATAACELAVHLDLGLVDAGSSPCTVCLDDADTVIYDDAGDPVIVPKDGEVDDAEPTTPDAATTPTSDAASDAGALGQP